MKSGYGLLLAAQFTVIVTGLAPLYQELSYSGTNRSTAELLPSEDRRFLYVSLRGNRSIVVYSHNASTGAAKEIQRIDSPGKTPWSLAIDPTGRWMVVVSF